MKREEPWQKAKRTADDANLKATIERRSAELTHKRAQEADAFDPMAIAWGDVDPPPPPKPSRQARTPRSRP